LIKIISSYRGLIIFYNSELHILNLKLEFNPDLLMAWEDEEHKIEITVDDPLKTTKNGDVPPLHAPSGKMPGDRWKPSNVER